jgi:DNA-binding transcriptional ArsR family regulator
MANQAQLDRAFAACAHPIRRGIIERLGAREMTVGEATGDFEVSKPSISKHLRVLEEAGAIVRVIDGRNHRLRLTDHALDEAQEWMNDQRALWERKFEVIDAYLAERRAQTAAGDRGSLPPRDHGRPGAGKESR